MFKLLISCCFLIRSEIEAKCRVTKFFHFLSNCNYAGMISVLCNNISNSLKLVSVEIALCSFITNPIFLTIFTKYSLNSFAISISSSIFSLFSTNLIGGLALTLFEKRGFKNLPKFFVIWDRIYIKICKMSFFRSFQEVYAKISLFFVLWKCWYSILFICFNISQSRWALNPSLRNFR